MFALGADMDVGPLISCKFSARERICVSLTLIYAKSRPCQQQELAHHANSHIWRGHDFAPAQLKLLHILAGESEDKLST